MRPWRPGSASRSSSCGAWSRLKREILDSGEILESSPKSEAGKITVSLPEPLAVELQIHLDA
jgi:hypothetical protein